jgi:hypothetical protein
VRASASLSGQVRAGWIIYLQVQVRTDFWWLVSNHGSNVELGLETGRFTEVEVNGEINKSVVWQNFKKIKDVTTNKFVNFVICNMCKKVLSYKSENGTSRMKRHAKACSNEASETAEMIIDPSERDLMSDTRRELKKIMTSKFVNWCANTIRPFDVVNDIGVRDIANQLVFLGSKFDDFNVAGILPNPRTISRNTEIEHNQIMAAIKPEVSAAITEGTFYFLFLC